jgi:uncharacterized protein
MFDRIGSLIIRGRWVVLLLLLATTVAAGAKALEVRFDFSPRSIFLTGDPEVVFLAAHREVFGDEDAFCIVLVEGQDIFEPAMLELVTELSDRIGEVEHIDQVLSLSTMQEISGMPGLVQVSPLLEDIPTSPEESAALRSKVLENQLYVHRFVNPEGTATAVMGKFENGFVEELERRPALAAIEAIIDEFQGRDGAALSFVGVPIVNREYAVLLAGDMVRTVSGAAFLVGILLFLLFRNAWGVALPLMSVGLAMAWTVGYMALAGDSFNIINSIVPALLLVIAVGDAVHFLTTYYAEIGSGADKNTAIRAMVRRIGGACFLTSLTASIGFASLIVARINIIQGMGRVAAVGLMVAYVVILFLVPTVLSLVTVPASAVGTDLRKGWIGRLLVWLGTVTTEKKGPVLAVTLAITAMCVAGAFRVKSDNFLLEELLPENPVSVALHHNEEVISGVMPVEIVVRTDEEGGIFEPEILNGIAELQEELRLEPFIGHSVSIVDLIREIARVQEGERKIPETRAQAAQYLLYFEMSEDPSFLDSMIDLQRKTARISATARDWGTNNFLYWLDGRRHCDPRATCGPPIVDKIDRIFGTTNGKKPGLSVKVTGGSVVAADALSRLVEDMLMSLGTAFFIISLLMMFLLRSLRIGLMSMLPNVLPLLIILGFMGWVGIPVRTSTALIFSVALGVAVNDTIHFLTRYREELFASGDRIEAVKLTLLSTGRAIIFTSLLLIGGFIVMMSSRFMGIFQMGLLGAVALFAALLGDLVLLPICLAVFKPWSRTIDKLVAAKAASDE